MKLLARRKPFPRLLLAGGVLLAVLFSALPLTLRAQTPVSLPLTTAADNKLDLGAFLPGATLTATFTGNGDLVDSRYQTKPDGSLFALATGGYEFANAGAAYPTQDGGDGVNHFAGGGANYDATGSGYGFATKLTTDTTDPAAIRNGAVVGTFSTSPARTDWFLIGNGATLTVPAGGAHLYVAVNDTFFSDNHGAYTGTLSATGGTPPPIPANWDAGRDFANNENNNTANRADNPNGLVPQWSYGYRGAIADGALTLFPPDSHIDDFGQVPSEHGFVAAGAGVSVNATAAPIFLSGGRGPIPPGNMAVDAFMPAFVSVVRWTAPAAGTFTYTAFWQDIDPNGGNGAGGYVVVNGQQVFGRTWDNGSDNGANTSAAVALQAGDSIDFVLDDKGDGGYDETLFNATIVPGGTPPPDGAITVPGTSNIWLAGAIPGTTASSGQDNLTNATPFQVPNLTLIPGQSMTFSATGSVYNDPANPVTFGPDGGPFLGFTYYGHDEENGIASLVAPVNSLVGVFLDDSTPDPTNVPAGYNFGSQDSPDYFLLAPALRKPFLIGDGTNPLNPAQKVLVPTGATRLFLGSFDPSDQENNVGSFFVKVNGGGGGTTSGAKLVVNSDDFSYTVKNQPNTGTVVPGDVITYSLTVRNTGTAPAANVVVKASFDVNNTKFKSATNGGTAAANVVTWTLPSLANGDHKTLTYSVKVKGTVETTSGLRLGAAVLSATADAPATALSTTNLPSVGLTVVPLFNLSTQSDGVTAVAGGPLTFTFTVVNRGTTLVDDITVDVHLPDGYVPANFKTASFLDDNGNPVGAPYKLGANLDNGQFDPAAVRLYIDNLAAGASKRFAVTVNVPYEAVPGSTISLPPVQLNGYIGDGKVTYNQPTYGTKISNKPPAAPPSVSVLKLVPTTSNLQSLLAVVNDPTLLNDPKNYIAKTAKQLFLALALYTGKAPADLQAMSAEQLALLLNPYVSVDTDPDSGDSLFDVPSPNAKQPDPTVTYVLLYFNTGAGDAVGTTITDSVASKLQLDPASITVKGATTLKNPVGSDGHSLTFTLGKIVHGSGGLIVYKAKVPAPASGGPALGDIIDPTTAALTTASLSGQNFYTPVERLLITGKANAIVEASESDPGNGTAVYTIYYKNTGGQKSKDLIVVSQVPTGGIFQSAQLLDIGQSHREPDIAKGERIYPPASPTSGRVVFELGKVKPREQGFVQVTYKLSDATLALKPAGLVHHYGIDQTSFPTASAVRPGRPMPRAVARGPETRFSLGDVGNFFKQGFNNVTHAISSVFGGNPQAVAPTIWLQRVAPLAVQENTDFSYVVTVGNSGKTPAYAINIGVQTPSNATFVSSTGGTYFPPVGGDPASVVIFSPATLVPGGSQTIKLTYHATAAAGSMVESANINGSGFGTPLLQYNSGDVEVGLTSSLVYSAQQARNFASLQTKIATNAAKAGGIDPGALSTGLLFAQRAAAITPDAIQTTIAHADYVVLTQGGSLVAAGAGNLVAAGAGNLVAAGAGNLVAAGAGNLVAAGAGNLITLKGVTGLGTLPASDLLSSNNVSKLIAAGAGNLVAAGAGNLISQDGSGLLDFRTGNSLIALSALPFKSFAAAGIGNAQSLGLISQDGAGLISQDGSGLISQDGAGFKAIGGASAVVSNDGGSFHRAVGGQPIRRAGSVKAGTVLGSPANSVSLDFNQNGNMVFGVGGSGGGQ